jgi:poly(3-hydroxybutyrate) depolymerase
MHRGRTVDTKAIRNVALLTVEGENDDISGLGQTEAAQTICPNIPDDMRHHYVQPKVGHYGVFNGSRFRVRDCAADPRFHAHPCPRNTAKKAKPKLVKGGKSD